MKLFLEFKHWQLFIIIVGLPLLGDIFLVEDGLLYIIIGIASVLCYLSWLYSLSVFLRIYKKSEPERLLRSKIYFYYIVLYVFSALVLFSMGFPFNEVWIPFHIICLLAFFCIFFECAKAIKALELKQTPPRFSDLFGYIFLLWFFPVGIWIIQPKINELV